MTVASVLGIGVAGGLPTVTWSPLLPANFISTAVYQDPNSVVNNPISVHASSGDVTFDLAEPAAARDGLAEGAYWRTNLLTTANGWLGDGSMGLAWKITPVDNPNVTSEPMIGFADCDNDGDVTSSSAAIGAGWCCNGANVGGAAITRTAGSGSGASAFIGHNPDTLCYWLPQGAIGDDTNAGIQNGKRGSIQCLVRSDPAVFNSARYSSDSTTNIVDGIYASLFACFDATGAGTFTVTLNIQYAYFTIYPVGTWT